MEFRWNDWTEGHISEHGVDPWEAEEVVREARPPYPLASAEGIFSYGAQPRKEDSSRSSSWLTKRIRRSSFMRGRSRTKRRSAFAGD